MNKSWVICMDGTWNAPGQEDQNPITKEEVVTKTNVQLLWEALSDQELDSKSPYGSIAELQHQAGEVMYINGVGSSGSDFFKRFDGTTGAGTSERILDAYHYLAQRWQPGDVIWCFGFSRGAFAARSLIGLIDQVGLPKHRRFLSSLEILEIFTIYQEKNVTSPLLETMQKTSVHFVGVWDTVESLSFSDSLDKFHQVNPKNIEHFRQALALDEQRKEFIPLYFDAKALASQKEVWFVGAHTNIGGGYADANLSNITLFWMLNEAKTQGLILDLPQLPGWEAQSPEGQIRNSYQEFWNAMPLIGKWVEKFHLEITQRKITANQLLHASALAAMRHGYRPHALASEGFEAMTVEPWRGWEKT